MAVQSATNAYSYWKPQTETGLDLRLRGNHYFKDDNEFITKKVSAMGSKLEILETQAAKLSITTLNVLRDNCPNLRRLNVAFTHTVGDTALRVIAQFSNLEELNLDGAIKDVEEEKPFEIFMTPPYLRTPEIIVESVTDAGLQTVLDSCKKLRKLDISRTGITLKSLRKINDDTDVTHVRIHSCWNLKTEELVEFQKSARSSLTISQENPELSAESDLRRLMQAVKDRYFRKIVYEGGPAIRVKEDVPREDIPFINPYLFARFFSEGQFQE